jgi:hypothetical protein
LRETDGDEIGYIEVASSDGGLGLHDLLSERMAEVRAGEPRAEQVAAVHLDREEFAPIEMAKRQIASNEAGFAQFSEGERRSDRRALIGEDAVFEGGGAKVGMRESAFDEAASEEFRLGARGIFPFDLGEIRIFYRISFIERRLKLFGRHASL